MRISTKIKAFMEKAAQGDGYWVNKAKLAFAVALEDRRKNAGLSYKDMAGKLDTSPAYISKVFRGDANLTIESMVKLARATGGQLRLDLVDAAADRPAWSLDAIRQAKLHKVASGGVGTVYYPDFKAANHDLMHRQQGMAA